MEGLLQRFSQNRVGILRMEPISTGHHVAAFKEEEHTSPLLQLQREQAMGKPREHLADAAAGWLSAHVLDS